MKKNFVKKKKRLEVTESASYPVGYEVYAEIKKELNSTAKVMYTMTEDNGDKGYFISVIWNKGVTKTYKIKVLKKLGKKYHGDKELFLVSPMVRVRDIDTYNFYTIYEKPVMTFNYY